MSNPSSPLKAEINGLTLAGVGRNTVVEYVETYACQDDGFEFLGGAVNTRYLISAFSGDDGFDIDIGYVGQGQFWFGIDNGNPTSESSYSLEVDGSKPDNFSIFSNPTLSNLTFLSNSEVFNTNRGILFRDGGAGEIVNSIIQSFPAEGLVLEADQFDNSNTYDRLLRGEIVIGNNHWFDFPNAGTIQDIVLVAEATGNEEQNVISNLISNGNSTLVDPQLTAICYATTGCLDPRPQAGSPALSGASVPSDPFFQQVSYRGAFGADNWMETWSVLYRDATVSGCSNLSLGTITLQADQNGNCQADPGEPGLAQWILKINTPSDSFFVKTNFDGKYNGFIPPTATQATAFPANYLWNVCTPTLPLVDLGVPGATNAAFAATAAQDCPLMTVDISSLFLRRCFSSTYQVQYCNQGTAQADDVRLELVLDNFLDFDTASIPFTQISDSLIRFDIGSMAAGECANFRVGVTVSCDASLGQSHCTEIRIYPDTICAPIQSRPRLVTEASCEGDSVLFTIQNRSDANMSQAVPYIVIEDHVMMPSNRPPFLLNAQQSMDDRVAANGSTYHMQTVGFPGFPELGIYTAGIEGCGENAGGGFSTGFLNGLPLSSNALASDQDCQANIGSYDPNDKTAYPEGVLEEHFLRANTDIDYRIRFQNTGTDTAFTVVIVDTLSGFLDPASISVGTSSHDYSWQLNNRTLTFRFDNILLPDSNVNEPASNGFVNFKISQVPDVPDGNQITNFADIYFDFNAPIRTNEVFHTIGQPYGIDVLSSLVQLDSPSSSIRVFPNPFANSTSFELPGGSHADGQLELYDASGRLIRTQAFSGDRIEFEKEDLGQGLYFFRITTRGKHLGSGKLLIAEP
ncbi:MAG: T9SS type A sorting domain-containing protein [Bacteroidota bacterium]